MELEKEWLKVLAKYSIIKEVFIICEETDPELNTNLQPINEFRAALDHVMKLNGALYKDEDEEECLNQFRKLHSHLDRAFFDICDMASINYRNMIIDLLEKYDADVIRGAIPEYYSQIRPDMDAITNKIINYRNSKGMPGDEEDLFQRYKDDVFKLKEYFSSISSKLPVLEEIYTKEMRKQKKANNPTYVGVVVAVIGIIVAIILRFI